MKGINLNLPENIYDSLRSHQENLRNVEGKKRALSEIVVLLLEKAIESDPDILEPSVSSHNNDLFLEKYERRLINRFQEVEKNESTTYRKMKELLHQKEALLKDRYNFDKSRDIEILNAKISLLEEKLANKKKLVTRILKEKEAQKEIHENEIQRLNTINKSLIVQSNDFNQKDLLYVAGLLGVGFKDEIKDFFKSQPSLDKNNKVKEMMEKSKVN